MVNDHRQIKRKNTITLTNHKKSKSIGVKNGYLYLITYD